MAKGKHTRFDIIQQRQIELFRSFTMPFVNPRWREGDKEDIWLGWAYEDTVGYGGLLENDEFDSGGQSFRAASLQRPH